LILLTGATGLVGSELLPRLIAAGRELRCLVRDPRGLGPNRVRVQITLGDLADPVALRQAVRGVDCVVHMAASIRDQPSGTIEELNGVATSRLLHAAEGAGVRRFVFFGALGATPSSPTRFLRAKALAQRAVVESDLDAHVLAPSIVYAPGDPFITLLGRMGLLPWMPVVGDALAAYQPIWASDVASCVLAAIDGDAAQAGHGSLHELAGPDTLTYEEMVRLVLEAQGRRRPIIHVPPKLVRRGLNVLGGLARESVFATWEEAELMEVPMTSARGVADAIALGVEPKPMREVLGLA
jgi:NADH dehydrogenase